MKKKIHNVANIKSDFSYFDFNVPNLVCSSDNRTPNHRWEYVGREVGSCIPNFNKLQNKIKNLMNKEISQLYGLYL